MPTMQEIRQQYPMYNDMSDQQLADGLYKKYYSDLPKKDFYGRIGFVPETAIKSAKTPEKDFFQRIGEDFERRKSIVREKRGEIATGTSPYIVGAKAAGQSAGFATDIAAEGFVSAFRALPDFIEDPIREAGTATLKSPVGQAGIKAIQAGGDIWEGFKKKHPDVASVTEDAANVLGLYYMMNPKTAAKHGTKAVKTGGKAAVKTGKPAVLGTKQVLKGLAARTPDQLDDAYSLIAKKVSPLFEAKKTGIILNKNRAGAIKNSLKKAIGADPRKKTSQNLYGEIFDLVDDIEADVNLGNFGLDDLHHYRQTLRRISNNNFIKSPETSNMARKLIRNLDKQLDNLAPIDFRGIGGKEATQELMTGIKDWTRVRKFEDVVDIIKKAEGDANKLVREFKKLYNKDKKMAGFTKEERKIIKALANPGKADAILKGLGRYGIDLANNNFIPIIAVGSLGLGAGQPGIAGALVGTGTLARHGRNLATKGKAEDLLRTIEGGIQSLK